jgi:hypothetical protein
MELRRGPEDLIEARRVAVIHEVEIFLQRRVQFRLARFRHLIVRGRIVAGHAGWRRNGFGHPNLHLAQ